MCWGWRSPASLRFCSAATVPSLVKSDTPRDTIRLASRPATKAPDYGVIWSMRRVLADFSEAPFFGNELASLGLLLGVLLAYTHEPDEPGVRFRPVAAH